MTLKPIAALGRELSFYLVFYIDNLLLMAEVARKQGSASGCNDQQRQNSDRTDPDNRVLRLKCQYGDSGTGSSIREVEKNSGRVPESLGEGPMSIGKMNDAHLDIPRAPLFLQMSANGPHGGT